MKSIKTYCSGTSPQRNHSCGTGTSLWGTGTVHWVPVPPELLQVPDIKPNAMTCVHYFDLLSQFVIISQVVIVSQVVIIF